MDGGDLMNLMDRSDEELIQAYQNGEEGALGVLISRYLRAIYHFAYRYCANGPDAEDIAQEVFVKAWKNLHRYDAAMSFRPWIFSIAKHAAIDWLRTHRAERLHTLELEGDAALAQTLSDSAPLPDELARHRDIALAADQTLEALSPQARTVVRLRYQQDLTFRQIGALLGRPLDTVKSQHRRAVALLKKIFKP